MTEVKVKTSTDPYFDRVAVLRHGLAGDTAKVKAALVELSDEHVAQLATVFKELAEVTQRWQVTKNRLGEVVHELRMARHTGHYNGFPVDKITFED